MANKRGMIYLKYRHYLLNTTSGDNDNDDDDTFIVMLYSKKAFINAVHDISPQYDEKTHWNTTFAMWAEVTTYVSLAGLSSSFIKAMWTRTGCSVHIFWKKK